MATVNPPATTTPVGGSTLNGSSAVTNPKATLDKDGFLKMLVAQLSHQDPTAPMDAADSMQQMSSFTMVEQITNLAAQNEKSAAVNLIGRTVTYKDDDEVEHTGTVEKVATGKDGKATLTIAGEPGVDPTSITQVA
jgi:flagellar basal-body rod modification protein FlgD